MGQLKETEADIKLTVLSYLQYQMNLGRLYFDRLNSGEFIELRGDTRRRVQGCRRGTSDLFVLKEGRVIFCELKRKGRKLTAEQVEFAIQVKKQGAECYVISDLDSLMEVLK